MAESETKAVLAVPVLGKGSISLKQVTEEIVRFTMATSSGQSVILQADGERSTRQILRAVQHCRAQLGLSTEIRVTGKGQHASNGQAERTVQTVRKMANCLRNQAETKASAQIRGSSDLYPWSFRHAAWLVTRYRVINGSTSFELMTDRKYAGRLVLYGESVMYKDITSLKGEPVYKRGVWVGRSTWSDSHIVLTPKKAVEARSIRRLPQQFHAEDMVAARGLPWNYSAQGILMKHRSTMMRPAMEIEDVAEDEEERRAKQAGRAVAMGLITPMASGAVTPGLAAPQTPRMMLSSMPDNPGGQATSSGMRGDEEVRLFEEEPQERSSRKREVEDAERESPKRGRTQQEEESESEMQQEESRKRPVEEDLEPAMVGSPKRLRRVQAEFPDGDEDFEDEFIMAAAQQAMEQDERKEDDDGPPELYDEDLEELDIAAEIEEEKRLIDMGVLIKLDPEAPQEEGSYNITTKMVMTWKHRQEKGGWFRRARLVARQYKWSVYTDDSFAPTSAYVILKLLLHRCIMDEKLVMHIADIKDAFLMVDQPEDEKATVTRRGVTYKLGKVLPGQRTAASQWFLSFKKKAEDYGMETDVMQPSLMRRKVAEHGGTGRLYLTIHVDDLFLVGDEGEAERFFDYLKTFGWKLESQGPMEIDEKFEYLKRKMRLTENGVIIRPDGAHIDDMAKVSNVLRKAPRKTPTTAEFSKIGSDPRDNEELSEQMRFVYRSMVGKLLYLAPDRPDVQFVAQGLSAFMKTPTWRAWKFVEHVSSYLFGTREEGLLMESTWPGRSVLNVNGSSSSHDDYASSGGSGEHDEEKNLLEVICDADYAGNQKNRKSLSSVQFYMDGNLLESYVRSQKSIALSSGESEYVCMVGGVSEAMFLQHGWKFLTGKLCRIQCRSDSSAARSLACRVGIGRIRHLAANLLWLQEKVNNKLIEVTAIPTAVNPADAGTKSLSRARMNGLKRIMKFVSEDGTWIGQEDYDEIENKEEMRKATKKFAKSVGGNAKVAMIVAMTLLQGSKGDNTMAENQMAIMDFEKMSNTTKNSYGSILFLTVAIFAIFGALSLATLCCWFGGSIVKKGKIWVLKLVSTGDAKKLIEMRELAAQRGVKIKMLEAQIEKMQKDQEEQKTRMMKMLTEERENRMSLVNREVATRRDVSLTNRQIGAIAHELTKLKVVVTKTGEAHHDVNCKFVHPPHSHSGVQYRACNECMPKAVRGVLESLGRTYSCGHTGT